MGTVLGVLGVERRDKLRDHLLDTGGLVGENPIGIELFVGGSILHRLCLGFYCERLALVGATGREVRHPLARALVSLADARHLHHITSLPRGEMLSGHLSS